ncbi:response regulator [Roseivivax sediminis]|uniref:Two-component system, chemotaxis family, response regulator CheY n=1 Tax=Roseivivax sediminis TaxID=936889 RepID=A0A1I1XNL1_9RHOB|nr:response regulator [Roseivivax sediminis]SFE08771.1 two-component system, chemotaxis family, response regulator CheY [Roseivivax sediminis]
MSLKILAIDDSRTIREMLRMCLARAGFDVHTAEDGVAGLDCLDAVDPDVVITDINMPRLDGFGVITAIRENAERTALPILVLTTESAQDLKQRARESGVTGWVVKPFDDVKLIAAIRRIAST